MGFTLQQTWNIFVRYIKYKYLKKKIAVALKLTYGTKDLDEPHFSLICTCRGCAADSHICWEVKLSKGNPQQNGRVCATKFTSRSIYNLPHICFSFFFFCKSNRKRVGQPQSDVCALNIHLNSWFFRKVAQGLGNWNNMQEWNVLTRTYKYVVLIVYCVRGKIVTVWKGVSLSFFKKLYCQRIFFPHCN